MDSVFDSILNEENDEDASPAQISDRDARFQPKLIVAVIEFLSLQAKIHQLHTLSHLIGINAIGIKSVHC